MKTSIGPLFKHFGSKWSASRRCDYETPLFGLPIVEPFAGAAGYSSIYSTFAVQLWDDDPNLLRLWPWLIQEAKEADIREIPINVLEGTDIRTLGLKPGQSLLLKHWQRTNNCGNCWSISPWGNKPGQWTANTRARVAEEVHAVKHWQWKKPNWTQSGTYFVDPPYLYNYRYRFAADSFDFADLARKVADIPADSLVIACEATCPKTGRVPDYLPFETSHRQVTSRRKTNNHHHSTELVYVRSPF